MATIGKLNWILGANSDKLQKDFAQSISSAKKFAGQMGSVLGNIGQNALLGSGLKGGIDDLKNMIGSALAAIPAIGPVASTAFLGLTTMLQEAIAKFRELKNEAKLFNTDVQGAAFLKAAFKDNLQPITMLQKKLAEAASGSKEAQKDFNSLGLSWEQLAETPLDKGLYILAERFAELKTHQEKVNFTVQIAGKQWQELFVILEKGSGHLDRIRSKVEASFSEAQVKRLEVFSAALKNVDMTWEKLKLTATEKAVHFLDDPIQAFKDLWNTSTFDLIKPDIESLMPQNDKVKGQIAELTDQQKQWAKGIESTADALKKQLDTLGMTATEVKLYELQMMGATEGQIEFARQVMDSIEATKGALEFTKGLEAALPWNQKGDWKAFQMPEVPVKNNLQAAQVGTVEGESYVRRLSREAEAKNLNDELSKQTANNTAEVVKILRRIERKDKELVDI